MTASAKFDLQQRELGRIEQRLQSILSVAKSLEVDVRHERAQACQEVDFHRALLSKRFEKRPDPESLGKPSAGKAAANINMPLIPEKDRPEEDVVFSAPIVAQAHPEEDSCEEDPLFSPPICLLS